MKEILIFVVTWPMLTTWLARAVIIAIATSAVLNISPFLPWLKDIEPSRINARWVGYIGLTLAFAIWTALCGDWVIFGAWVIIAVTTLLPNTLIHWRAESTDGGEGENTQTVFVVPMDKFEEVLQHLWDPRRNLTIALEDVNSAVLKAQKMADRIPDRMARQELLVSMNESLDEAKDRISETRDGYKVLWKAVSMAWHHFNNERQALILSTAES